MTAWVIQMMVMVLSVFTGSSQGKRDKVLYCSGKSRRSDRSFLSQRILMLFKGKPQLNCNAKASHQVTPELAKVQTFCA